MATIPTLPTNPSTQQEQSAEELKSVSCVTCRRRKLKCDRKIPCSRCIRSNIECIFPDPVRLRHQRKPELVLMTRLRQYEDLLRKNGIDPNVVDRGGIDVDASIGSVNRSTSQTGLLETASGAIDQVPTGQYLSRDGKSIYFDYNVWKILGTDIEDTESILDDTDSDNQSHVSGNDLLDASLDADQLLFASSVSVPLTKLHPSSVHIFKLWHIFLENVNPLTKIIYAPVVQQQILSAMDDLGSMGKGFEALLFAVYCCALNSLTDEEVQTEFGTDKKTWQKRFRMGTQRALANAGFTKTTDLVVLQALLLFIISVRADYHQRTLWCLSGVAIRIAQQLGIHRDGSSLGISIFETEMRRRVWWQLVTTDRLIARLCGSLPAPLPPSDTQMPTNVNDTDLHPDMKERPVNNSNATEMIFCMMRYEFSAWIHRQLDAISTKSADDPWRLLTKIGREKSEAAARDLERTLNEKIIEKCDPAIPLHLLAVTSARLNVAFLRLMLYDPFHAHERGDELSEFEKDNIFDICLQVAQLSDEIRAIASLNRYLWHLDYHFPWPALIFMLSEIRYRPVGETTERAWYYISSLYSRHSARFGFRVRGQIHVIISKLAVKAWDIQKARYQQQGLPLPDPPEIVRIVSKFDHQGDKQPTMSDNSDRYPSNAQSITASPGLDLGETFHNTADMFYAGNLISTTEASYGSLPSFLDETTLLDENQIDLDNWNEVMLQFPQNFEMPGYF